MVLAVTGFYWVLPGFYRVLTMLELEGQQKERCIFRCLRLRLFFC